MVTNATDQFGHSNFTTLEAFIDILNTTNPNATKWTTETSTEDGEEVLFYGITMTKTYKEMFIYGLGFFLWVGTIGNILSLMTLQRKRLRGKSTSIYLSSLAVADILSLWVLNQSEWFSFLLGKPIVDMPCNFRTWQVATFTTWSSWVVVAVTTERYIAVCYPLKAVVLNTSRRAYIAVTAIPLTVMLSCLFVFFTYLPKISICLPYPNMAAIVSKVSIVMRAFVPGLILSILNVRIILAMRTSRKMLSGSNSNVAETDVRQNDVSRITKTVVFVSLAHIILTVPIGCFLMYIDVVTFYALSIETLSYLFLVVEMLSLSNHSINFILYMLSSSNLRFEFLQMITFDKYGKLFPLKSGKMKKQVPDQNPVASATKSTDVSSGTN